MADWTEPSQDILMKCPYCPANVAKRRFLLHLTACAKKHLQLTFEGTTVVVCPFNKEHHILADDFEPHMIGCVDARSAIDSNNVRGDLLTKLQSMTLEDSYKMNPSSWQRKLIEKDGTSNYANLAKLLQQLSDDPHTPIAAHILMALPHKDRMILNRERMKIIEWSGLPAKNGQEKKADAQPA